MSTLSGKTALITGASRGIGEATARLFAARGANVVLTARSTDAITTIANDIGAQARAMPCDVADYAQVAAAVQMAVDTFGGLDILVGNAGVIEPVAHIATADPAGWGQAIDINLKGVFHGMRAAMPVMQSAGGGTIITISSGAAHNPLEGWSHYCASKAGAAMLTRAAHLEGAENGLRIMGLSPGTVATQMQREIKATGINPVSQMEWTDHIPPEWPAQCLLWMCTPDADDWLGQEISLRDPAIRAKLGLGQ
ncbi:SDR family oxidoreductase [Lutimaribacter sp. EGI FJ00015]|uniref:SDR family oxidoreductase n=1 Tax=Lutimaribacter degradans TaxID=2945989 RepID=A0ACC5ZUF8_9RHOB|nr:SDR family oxidoreductase [Lutimaribacter sp. EGI FJ00013]MCM2561765.1 SDR family oxidoreductase [Lutimaribacter sp. EGI FJ00013]MCO0613203.1 SDR family oxidoreductase [Lutimaribacter sp. EGI FJ00015]MCO0635597.1 SDR family oxidoreductase [Lutimaribacter sp. EGI FJ00014]